MSHPGLPMHPAVAAAAAAAAIASPIPTRSQLDAYNVNRQGWEGITQALYDSNAYPAAGQNVLSFFNLPIGQGTGVGGGTKTLSDTNMTLAGQMAANTEFLIQSIEVIFQPSRPAVAGGNPSEFHVAAINPLVNDSYLFWQGGNLVLTIGSKDYLQEGPLGVFPPKAWFEVQGAYSDTTTAGLGQTNQLNFASARGRPYLLKAALRLVSNQNFGVTLNWPEGKAAITNPARVFVRLDGVFYRRSQ